MYQSFTTHCDRNYSWDPNRPLVVACSGGLDSVVLVHLMHAYHGNLILAHMNYGLRGEDSNQDEALVAALGKELDYEVVIRRVDPDTVKNQARVSVQMKARALRYAFFENVMMTHKAQGVLTAHHADDNLETFLINLSRGTGLKGLMGIADNSDSLYRPLLTFKRDQILAYAQKQGCHWREDASNQSDDYQRNIIRHHISPGFEKLDRPWDQSLIKAQRHLTQAHTLLEDYLISVKQAITQVTEDGLQLDLKAIAQYPNYEVLLSALCHEYGVGAGQDVIQLARAQSGARIITDTHEILKDRAILLINTLEDNLKQADLDAAPDQWHILDPHSPQNGPVKLAFEQVNTVSNEGSEVIFVPTQKLSFPLKLRRWQQGDVFYPFGGPGKKKISKYFKDERLSLVRKKKTWILECAGSVMWVIGLRGDERFRVPDQCVDITKISVVKK